MGDLGANHSCTEVILLCNQHLLFRGGQLKQKSQVDVALWNFLRRLTECQPRTLTDWTESITHTSKWARRSWTMFMIVCIIHKNGEKTTPEWVSWLFPEEVSKHNASLNGILLAHGVQEEALYDSITIIQKCTLLSLKVELNLTHKDKVCPFLDLVKKGCIINTWKSGFLHFPFCLERKKDWDRQQNRHSLSEKWQVYDRTFVLNIVSVC